MPFAVYEGGAEERAEYTERLTSALEQDRRGDAVELFLRLTGLGEGLIQGARQSPMWPGMESIAPSLAYDDAVMGDGLVPEARLASITAPVLSLAGGASPEWMREAARIVADTAPRGTYRVLERQSHMVEPEVLAPVLAEFFGQ